MNYENDIYRKPYSTPEEDEWNRIEMRNQTGGMPVFGENHPLPVRDPSEGPSKPLPTLEPEQPLPDEKDPHSMDWGDLMKQAGSSLGGGQTQANGVNRPAFGSGNTVQSGGFGKYRGMVMEMI